MTDSAIEDISHFFDLRDFGVAFAYGLTHYPCALWSTVQLLLQQLDESQQRVITLLLLSAVTSSVNTSNLVLVAAIHARSLPRSCLMFTSCFSPSPAFSLPNKLILVLCVQRQTNFQVFLIFFLAKSDLAFLLFSVTRGLHLVINRLYLLMHLLVFRVFWHC